MRSATGTAAVWFLIGVAGALSLTSLVIVTLPLAIVLTVVALRRGLRDRWLWSTALLGAAVVFLFFGVRQWGVPDCSGGNSDTGSLTILPGERTESRCGGLPATPVIVLALLAGALGVGGLISRSIFATTRASGGGPAHRYVAPATVTVRFGLWEAVPVFVLAPSPKRRRNAGAEERREGGAGTLAEGRRRTRVRLLADQPVRGDPGAAISRKGCRRLKGWK